MGVRAVRGQEWARWKEGVRVQEDGDDEKEAGRAFQLEKGGHERNASVIFIVPGLAVSKVVVSTVSIKCFIYLVFLANSAVALTPPRALAKDI